MSAATQAQSFGAIRIEGQGNQLIINQIVHILASEVKSQPFWPASPYLGLKPFDEADKTAFFGRDRTVAALVRAVAQHPLLMISGASGSGKSSVVRAGLLPQLRKLVQGFRSFKMKPGSSPFESLKRALISGGLEESEVEFATAAQPDTLACIRELRPPEECWLLFVDQFEEVFTLCERPEHRDAFLAALLAGTEVRPDGFKVVLAMRADFFDRFDLYPEFLEQVRRGLLFVTSPTPEELRQCMEQPAAQHGVVFEEGLVDQMLFELKGQPGALPLLQYALQRLWITDNPADDRTLNKSSYMAMGGVRGALCQRADAVYAYKKKRPRTEEEQQTMRRVLLRLIEVSGQEDSAPLVSRRRPLSRFSESEQAIIRELVEEKLLITNAEQRPAETSQSAPRFEEATVEIAHESLISAWSKLADWLKEARQVLYIHHRLSQDAREWSRLREEPNGASRADEELWSGTRLTTAQELRTRGDFQTLLGGLGNEEKSFLDASLAHTADRLRREREAAEKIRQQLLDTYIDRGAQLLFEKHQPYSAVQWLFRAYQQHSKNPSLPYLLQSAMVPVEATQLVLGGHGAAVTGASFSPDGQRIVTASRTARVWAAENGRLLAELTGHGADVLSASFSPDGQRIATASKDRTARVWATEDGRLLAELTGHGGVVSSASFSPDGQRIVTASGDQTARVWAAEDGRLLAKLGEHGEDVLSASFSPDGQRIVTTSKDGTPRVWTVEDGRLLAELTESFVISASFSPDGQRIVTASVDGTARVWAAENGRLLNELTGHGAYVLSASFSPDGQRIVTASVDGTARVWAAEHGRLLAELIGHGSAVISASFSPNGQRIVTASGDQTARVWAAEHGRLLAELTGHGGNVLTASFSRDGQRIVTASRDGTARVWAAEHGRLLTELTGHWADDRSVSFSPDGQRIVTVSLEGMARLWAVEDGRLLAELRGPKNAVASVSFSPDGQRIVTASRGQTARVWAAEDGLLLAELTGHRAAVISASFSRDGQRIVTSSEDGTARLWATQDGRLLAELTGHGADVLSASFSPNGQRIVTASKDRTARLWAAQDGRLLAELGGHGADVFSASFSRDDQRIVTASEDGTARLWAAQDGRLLAELGGHGADIRSASFSPDGHRIVTASKDRTARLWAAQDGRLLAELTGHKIDVESATFSPDGHRIVTVCANHKAHIWNVSPEVRTPEQLDRIIRCRSCVRFDREDGSVLVRCVPSPDQEEDRVAP